MGFLSVKGGVLTYNQYKERIQTYKKHGLLQFLSLYKAHKDRMIPIQDLKWGEEMEYVIYLKDFKKNGIKLSSKGPDLIKKFNESNSSRESDVILMPEFGSWMIEAVPSKPYNSLLDPNELLSCEEKLHVRRQVLNDFC